jgi:hypothetical protein
MKALMNTAISLFVVLLGMVPARADVVGQHRLKVANYLREHLVSDFARSTGMENFRVTVTVDIDQAKLLKGLTRTGEDLGKYEDLDLPGLYLQGQQEQQKNIIEKAELEDLLLAVDRADVALHHQESAYSESVLRDNLRKLVSDLLPAIGAEGIAVVVNQTDPLLAPVVRPPSSTQQLVQALRKPLGVVFDQGNFAKFFNTYFAHVIGGAGLLFLLFLLSQYQVLRSGFSKVAESLSARPAATTMASTAQPTQALREAVRGFAEAPGLDSFKSYLEASEHLKQTAAREPEIFEEILLLKLMSEDFRAILILMDVLNKKQKDAFLGNMAEDKKARFKSFIVEDGTRILKDDAALKQEAVKLIKLVTVASYAPEDLVAVILADACEGLPVGTMRRLLADCTDKEKIVLVDFIATDALAVLLHDGTIGMEALNLVEVEATHQELLDLVVRASLLIGHRRRDVKRGKLEQVYGQLETEKAELLADTLGIDPALRLDNLFARHETRALEYLEALDFGELAALYGFLAPETQARVLAQMPDLLAERLKFAKRTATHDSLKAKGVFYDFLRALDGEASSQRQRDDHLRLAA